MGKKTKRKIRWRRLSMEDESSLTDSSSSGPEGEAAGSHSSEESSSSSGGYTAGDRSGGGGPRNRRNNAGPGGRPGSGPSNKGGHHQDHLYHGPQHFSNGQSHMYPSQQHCAGMFPQPPNYYCNPMAPGGFGHGHQQGRNGGAANNGNKRNGQHWQGYNRRNGAGGRHGGDYNDFGGHHNGPLHNGYHQQSNGNSCHPRGQHQYPGSDKRFLFIAETCYFNNKEYTKIQTPHQDLLFKKGWLSSRKKDLDGLNIPDRSAEAQKLADEYRAAEQGKASSGASDDGNKQETDSNSSSSPEVQDGDSGGDKLEPDQEEGTGTTSSPEPMKDYQNAGSWFPDPSLCGDYYPPAPAFLIPCEVTDHMGQSYPAMMVQHPFYAPVQWAVLPYPTMPPYFGYDVPPPPTAMSGSSSNNKFPPAATSTLAAGMSSLEITEETTMKVEETAERGKTDDDAAPAVDGDVESASSFVDATQTTTTTAEQQAKPVESPLAVPSESEQKPDSQTVDSKRRQQKDKSAGPVAQTPVVKSKKNKKKN